MSITWSEGITILAILFAPIAAVQVQKIIENWRQDKAQKLWIFKSLMATRAAQVSPIHVEALNMIDLEFRGKRYSAVKTAWKIYRDHLTAPPNDKKGQDSEWNNRRVEYLTNLLLEMGRSLKYDFDEVDVKKGIYSPEAHYWLDQENDLIRKGLLSLLYGRSDLQMKITSLPVGEQALADQDAIREAVRELLEGERALPVSLTSHRELSSEDPS